MTTTTMNNGNLTYGRLIGALDNGTSSTRFIIFSANTGASICSHQIPTTSVYPQKGWVEQDPKIIIKTSIECINKAAEKLETMGLSITDIATIGITNQRETVVAWDKHTGQPFYNAIVWMDNRTESTVTAILETKKNKDLNQFREITGLPIHHYFSATKFQWLIRNVPLLKNAIENGHCLFGTMDSWLIWNLTGGTHITDVTNASRTLLMNLNTLQWDEELINFFEIPQCTLPEIRSSSEIYGKLSVSTLKNIPISGCIGDQHAALIGHLCFQQGDTKCTYGTGAFILSNTGKKKVTSHYGLLTTVAFKLGKHADAIYALEGSIASAGSTMTWLQNNLSLFEDLSRAENLVSSVPDCGGIYFVPALQGLYAPYWKQNAKGLIQGITVDTSKGQIIRAAIEGICYQVAAVLDSMVTDSGIDVKRLYVDGGMCHSQTLLQFQANISGATIVKPETVEITAFGAAIAAGQAENIEVLNIDNFHISTTNFEPKFSKEERLSRIENWERVIPKCSC